MNLLALHSVGHDACVSYFEDGRLVYSIEVERITRRKHDHRIEIGLQHCLDNSGVDPANIDLVAVSTPVRGKLLNIPDIDIGLSSITDGALHHSTRCRLLGRSTDCVVVAHEVSHASLALHYAGYADDCLILTNEGRGHRGRASIFHFSDGRLQWLDVDPLPWYGTGFGWSGMGYLLGFGKGPSVAGKLMALSGYGRVNATISGLLEAVPDAVMHDRALAEKHGSELAAELDVGDDFQKMADVVATFQSLFTRSVTSLVLQRYRALGCSAVGLGGGCALNLLANSQLRRALGHDIAIPPACNDAGQALGVGIYAQRFIAGVQPEPFSVYSNGRAQPRMDAIDALRSYGLDPIDFDPTTIARALADGAIVAVVDGAGELGPRALGNRSLLANPKIDGMRRRLSEELKQREWFRPLGAVMRLERFEALFPAEFPSPYMLQAYDVPPDLIPAAMHIDGTSRIQTLEAWAHPRLTEVLIEFERITSVPALINTSLNRRGLAIAHSVQDALDDFRESDVDLFWVQDLMAWNVAPRQSETIA
jgi:carbamoyltransferase